MTEQGQDSLHEWMPDPAFHNFGDHLARLLGKMVFTDAAWSALLSDPTRRYVLLGSFISNYCLHSVLKAGAIPWVIGCGARGEGLDPNLLCRAVFVGCRGMLWQNTESMWT